MEEGKETEMEVEGGRAGGRSGGMRLRDNGVTWKRLGGNLIVRDRRVWRAPSR